MGQEKPPPTHPPPPPTPFLQNTKPDIFRSILLASIMPGWCHGGTDDILKNALQQFMHDHVSFFFLQCPHWNDCAYITSLQLKKKN